jgi:uncharacterized RDD family membrane protein YckC
MKCPKCQYISFDNGERCRNCGYDFSLSVDVPPADLPIQDPAEPIGPFTDFTLHERAPDTGGLPLFRRESPKPDEPLVVPSLTPRAPLAVRRGVPAVTPRQRPKRTEADPEPRLALDTAEIPIVTAPPVLAASTATAPAEVETAESGARANASAGARLGGGLLDAMILGGVDLAVLYFTLKLCDMNFLQTLSLPLAPLVSFLALLNGGYLATFVAANGQTIGKMAFGTRVVSADPAAATSDGVSFGQALIRAAGYLVSLLPAGLGFVPAFFGDRRAVHDRLADTRVVRA